MAPEAIHSDPKVISCIAEGAMVNLFVAQAL